MNLPLQGYRIIDFTKLLPGPLTTLWMAQQGAEVIKVESPRSPDTVRWMPPARQDGNSAFYHALNAGKKSVSVDYRSEAGKQAILKLIATADVVLEQFRPGVMESFGLGYVQLKKENERLILVSLTGYGQSGVMANWPGHDINYLSYSGVLDGLRDKHGEPVIPTAQLADVAGGSMMALNATVTALLQRERTGKGGHIDVAMARNASVLQMLRAVEQAETNNYQGHLSGNLASYNVYRCADGRHVALGALEPKFWQKFCNLVGHPEWGARLLEKDLIGEVADLFATKPMQYWVDLLEKEHVCLSPVLTLDEAAKHPLFKNGFPEPFGPGRLSTAPSLGAHNAELL